MRCLVVNGVTEEKINASIVAIYKDMESQNNELKATISKLETVVSKLESAIEKLDDRVTALEQSNN